MNIKLNHTKKFAVLITLIIILNSISGCSWLRQTTTELNNLKEQAVDVTKSEVAQKLQESLQKNINYLQSASKNIVQANGLINWQEMKKANLAEYVFFTVLSYEFKAVLKADGTVEVLQLDKNTGNKKIYATYKVLVENGKVTVK